MRTTLVLSEAAYEVARSISQAQRRSIGDVISELILQPKKSTSGLQGPNELGFYGFSTKEPLTAERVKELLDDE